MSPAFGFLYGGSSRTKDDVSPLRTVLVSTAEAIKETAMPNMTARERTPAEINEPPAKNMAMMAIRVGNRPLQGTKLLVMTATSLSLYEFIILHPDTPAALQPKPMAIVRACFPQARQPLKHLSRLKATRGR